MAKHTAAAGAITGTVAVAATVTPPIKVRRPTSLPISLLPTSISKQADLAHSASLLLLFTLRFNSLVRDPVAELWRCIVPLIAIQLAWCITCLPPVTKAAPRPADTSEAIASKKPTSTSTSTSTSRSQRSRPAPKPASPSASARAIPALLATTLSLLPGAPILLTLLILFGAPLTTHLPSTALLATHVSLLALPPLIYTRGVDSGIWREIMGFWLPFDGVWGGTVGALVGCWVGAVPIPLDWGREWQAWPVTLVVGGYGGYVVGKVLGEFAVRGKRIEFGREEEKDT